MLKEEGRELAAMQSANVRFDIILSLPKTIFVLVKEDNVLIFHLLRLILFSIVFAHFPTK